MWNEIIGYVCFALAMFNGYFAIKTRQPINIIASILCFAGTCICLFFK